MRLISQNGYTDVPYEEMAIDYYMPVPKKHTIVGNSSGHINVVMGQYSSEEKALKAMEMLRKQYEKLEVFKVLASGTVQYMEKVLNDTELVKYNKECREMNTFQFPQDDEIEV